MLKTDHLNLLIGIQVCLYRMFLLASTITINELQELPNQLNVDTLLRHELDLIRDVKSFVCHCYWSCDFLWFYDSVKWIKRLVLSREVIYNTLWLINIKNYSGDIYNKITNAQIRKLWFVTDENYFLMKCHLNLKI